MLNALIQQLPEVELKPRGRITVTASGRTITYTNTLPRYILATAQYRFSIQPRK